MTKQVEATPSVMLDALAGFLRRYLVCTEHQLAILALWVVHTWCFEHFYVAAYLNICSPESQSGKTLCLELLQSLCGAPWLAAGADSKSVMKCLLRYERRVEPGEPCTLHPPFTILLDDCHHTLFPFERQPLLALLNSGSRVTSRFVSGRVEYCVFSPKAFAGNSSLPRSLASRCIPIVLERRSPSDLPGRFDSEDPEVRDAVSELREWLNDWTSANSDELARVSSSMPEGIASGLAPHQQGCAEPLVHIADLIGGAWSGKARASLASVFSLADASLSVQALSDIRASFFVKDNPEFLSSRDLLAALRALDHRPWAAWPETAGRRLGALLHPFGIVSRNIHMSSDKVFRGYLLRDFQSAFDRYLPPLPARSGSICSADVSSTTGFSLEFNNMSR